MVLALAAFLLASAPASQAQDSGSYQSNVDRPGSDYADFDLAAPAPEECLNACLADPYCKAWSYVRPRVEGPNARCRLKNEVPAQQANNCCISGVRAADRQGVTTGRQQGRPEREAARPPFRSNESEVSQVRACIDTLLANSPSAPAVYAEMRRQSAAAGEPPPAISERSVAAWLRDAALLQCAGELGIVLHVK